MSIIKDKLTNSNDYLFDSNLTMSAKGLLAMLINLEDTFGFTMETIISLTNNGPDAVRSVTKELINKNYLQRIKVRDEKGYYQYNYIVYDKYYEKIKMQKERG